MPRLIYSKTRNVVHTDIEEIPLGTTKLGGTSIFEPILEPNIQLFASLYKEAQLEEAHQRIRRNKLSGKFEYTPSQAWRNKQKEFIKFKNKQK